MTFALRWLGWLHTAFERMSRGPCILMDLHYFSFSDLVSENSGYSLTCMVNLKHDFHRLFFGKVEETLQYFHYEFHSCVIIIVE